MGRRGEEWRKGGEREGEGGRKQAREGGNKETTSALLRV